VSSLQTSTPANARLYAIVTPDPGRGSFEAQVIDTEGRRYVQLKGYRTVATPNAIHSERLKGLRAMLAPSPVAA
jgi:hypothetical protein